MLENALEKLAEAICEQNRIAAQSLAVNSEHVKLMKQMLGGMPPQANRAEVALPQASEPVQAPAQVEEKAERSKPIRKGGRNAYPLQPQGAPVKSGVDVSDLDKAHEKETPLPAIPAMSPTEQEEEDEKLVNWKNRGINQAETPRPAKKHNAEQFTLPSLANDAEEVDAKVDLVFVKNRFREYASKYGFDRTNNMLARFGITKISELNPASFQEFLHAIREDSK